MHGKALIASKTRKSFIILELNHKGEIKKTIEFENKFGSFFNEHKICGKGENMISVLTKDGWFVLYKFELKTQKVAIVDRIKLDLNLENEETPFTSAIHDNIFIIAFIDSRKILSKIIVYELNNRLLEFRVSVNLSEQNLAYVRAMEIQGVYGDKLMFTAVTCSNPTTLLNFSYDRKKKTVKELPSLRRVFEAGNIIKLVKDSDGGFITTDHSGKVVRIRFME